MPAKALPTFPGFPRAARRFLADLAANNDRAWFNDHKDVYKEQLVAPALDFVTVMGRKLARTAPEVVADPRSNGSGSLFRIYRDTRFSKDKTPYKTHLSMHFS